METNKEVNKSSKSENNASVLQGRREAKEEAI